MTVARKLAAEALGTALLLAAVVGSGIMGDRDGAGGADSDFRTGFVATFGLLAVIWGVSRSRHTAVGYAVAAYITAAYWFTASTSFANPAVTLARSVTDTFAGIRPEDAAGFIAAQMAGAVAATVLFRWFHKERVWQKNGC